jgi:hypothetical protein
MPAGTSDIHLYKSGVGDSEGGAKTATEVTNAVLNNLFPNISDASRLAGGSMSRKFFFANEHATDPYTQPRLWIASMPSGVVCTVGVGYNDADDDSIAGGDMTAWTSGAALAAISDGADTRTLTIIGIVGGVAVQTTLTLTGTTEAVTPEVFSSVLFVMADSKSLSRTVTIKQGAGGTTRGTIPPNRGSTFLLYSPVSKATGLWWPDLIAGGSHGVWIKLTWAAGISAQSNTAPLLNLEDS